MIYCLTTERPLVLISGVLYFLFSIFFYFWTKRNHKKMIKMVCLVFISLLVLTHRFCWFIIGTDHILLLVRFADDSNSIWGRYVQFIRVGGIDFFFLELLLHRKDRDGISLHSCSMFLFSLYILLVRSWEIKQCILICIL